MIKPNLSNALQEAEMSDEKAIKRIALTPSVFDDTRDFCNGLTANYSEGLQFLLQQIALPGEDTLTAGRRLRDQFNQWKAAQKE